MEPRRIWQACLVSNSFPQETVGTGHHEGLLALWLPRGRSSNDPYGVMLVARAAASDWEDKSNLDASGAPTKLLAPDRKLEGLSSGEPP